MNFVFHWIARKVQYATTAKKSKASFTHESISANLQENLIYLKDMFQNSSDIIFRPFSIGTKQEVDALILAVDGLYDKITINDNVLKPLMKLKISDADIKNKINIENGTLSVSSMHQENSMDQAIAHLMKGDPLLFVDGYTTVFIIHANSWAARNIEQPTTETSVRGPKESFSETLRTNTAMLRRKIHHPKLQIQNMTLGRLSRSSIALAYIDDIVSPGILEELKKRLNKLDIDAILDAGYIEELIADSPLSVFPTVAYSERPDKVAARLLEGRVAIFVEGSPFTLIVPHILMESFHNVDDYYSRPYYSSLMRLLRLAAFLMATLLPAVFVAAQDYHKEMFPTDLLISVASAREGVPFPLFFEVFGMTLAFEALKESGIRMPSSLGQAVAIVGGLVLGQAAVDAGIVGNATIIIIAMTAITTFLSPSLNDTTGILRLLYLIAGAIFGMYGIMLMISFLLLHVASLRSFGIPYMAPYFPITWSGWKDLFIRAPLWRLDQRPEFMQINNKVRQGKNQKPEPPTHGDEQS